jgi:hypothetical protein
VEIDALDFGYNQFSLSLSNILKDILSFICETSSFCLFVFFISFSFCIIESDRQLVYWDASGGLRVFRATTNQSLVLVPPHVVVPFQQNFLNIFSYDSLSSFLVKLIQTLVYVCVLFISFLPTKSRSGERTNIGPVTTAVTFFFVSITPAIHRMKANSFTAAISRSAITPSTTP